MRCLGRKKNIHRCKNNAKFLFCGHHKFQVLLLIISLGTTMIWVTSLSESLGFKKPIEVFNSNDIPEFNQEQTLKADKELETIIQLLDYRAQVILNKLPSFEDKMCSKYGNETISKFKSLHKKNLEALENRNFVLSHELIRDIHELLIDVEEGGCVYFRNSDYSPSYLIANIYGDNNSMINESTKFIFSFAKIKN